MLKRSKLFSASFPWQMLMVLMLGVIIPTACVIWFMNEAVKNERLAVKQKVHALYLSQLTTIKQGVVDHWDERKQEIHNTLSLQNSSQKFYTVVENGLADSLILYSQEQEQSYPLKYNYQKSQVPSHSLASAEKLEFRHKKLEKALAEYKKVAEISSSPIVKAEAIMAQARCLAKLDNPFASTQLLASHFINDKYAKTTNPNGALLRANALYRIVQLYDENQTQTHERIEQWNILYQQTLVKLEEILTDYESVNMPSRQRQYLLGKSTKYLSSENIAKWLRAEQLAAQYVESKNTTTNGNTFFQKTTIPDIWQFGTNDNTFTALVDSESIDRSFNIFAATLKLPDDVRVQLQEYKSDSADTLASIPIHELIPGWNIVLLSNVASPFEEAAKRQIDAYLWTGVLIILAIVILMTLTAAYVGKQIKISRLKNDLIATVSHELKTPLASIRLLVDTLRNNDEQYDETTKDYLQLISKENVRLTQLIDNFLTFSRMERNRQVFNFQTSSVNLIAESAIDAVKEKFHSEGFTLEAQYLSEDINIYVDQNMLVTALINLLENALKYSRDKKNVMLSLHLDQDELRIKILDQGIGIARKDLKRIFDRFYRVDQQLSQETDGCGLGLSIVNFIVQSHSGHIDVESELGKGSCFTIHLPHIQ